MLGYEKFIDKNKAFKICPPASPCESKGFTLAETLIVLVVLGIVGMITIPNVVKRYQESLARTKLKKIMGMYDWFVSKTTMENEFRSGKAFKDWANDDGKCTNSRKAFRIVEGDGCVFKTTDGVWLDLTDITNPVIAMSKKDMEKYNRLKETDGVGSFKLTTSYDSKTSAFRTNDLVYEQNRLEEELAAASEDTKWQIQQKIEELKKVYGAMEPNNKNISAITCADGDIICQYRRGDTLPECQNVSKSCIKNVYQNTYSVFDNDARNVITYTISKNSKGEPYKSREDIKNVDGSETSIMRAVDSNGNVYKSYEDVKNADKSEIHYHWEVDSNCNVYKSYERIQNADNTYCHIVYSPNGDSTQTGNACD